MSNTTDDPRRTVRGQVRLKQGEIIELDPLNLDSPKGTEGSHLGSVAIVVSHDCDINASADKEPFVEFIPLKKVRKLDSTKTHTKSARSLQFEAKDSEQERPHFFEADANSKFSLKKSSVWDLEVIRPYVISAEQVSELANWLSIRYRRAALPNEFEKRYRKARDEFWQLIQGFNHDLLAVLFLFDEGQERRDCKKEEPYTLSILLIHSGAEPSDYFEPLIKKINELFESRYIGSLLSDDAGIEIRNCAAISEFALPLAAYRRAISHRVDWLSYESEPKGPHTDI